MNLVDRMYGCFPHRWPSRLHSTCKKLGTVPAGTLCTGYWHRKLACGPVFRTGSQCMKTRAAFSGGAWSGFVGGCRIMEAGNEDTKRIGAELVVFAPLETVWDVLRDYGSLADVVPNLAKCERLPSKNPAVVLLYQKAFSQTVFWRVEAAAVLRVTEHLATGNVRELRFSMLSGDFEAFKGRWVLERIPQALDEGETTLLRYEIQVVPKLQAVPLPRALLTHLLKQGLPANISALAAHAERIAQAQNRGLMGFLSSEEGQFMRSRKQSDQAAADAARAESGKWASSSSRTPAVKRGRKARSPQAWQYTESEESGPAPGWVVGRVPMYLGVSSVPLPGERAVGEPFVSPDRLEDTGDDRSNAIRASLQAAAGAGKGGGGPPAAGAPPNYPSFDFIQWSEADTLPGCGTEADTSALRRAEVHLRKLDANRFLHRRLVAGIEIEAPPEKVWAAITNYEGLTDILPALVVSELVPPVRGHRPYPPGMSRVRQLAVKKLAYVEVHTELVLDVLEKGGRELQFRQYEGDFDVFQGKWILEDSPFNELRDTPLTVVRYAVEMAIETSYSNALGLVEPLVERIAVEDIPANLAALKAYVEGSGDNGRKRRKLDTFDDLRAELQSLYGDVREIPSRQELRDAGRVDIEVAIAAHGGMRAVVESLGDGWVTKAPSRRPKGYWTPDNIRAEIDAFNDDNGLPAGTMPSKAQLVNLGRKDLYVAIAKKGGGFSKLSELFGYPMSSRVAEPQPAAASSATATESVDVLGPTDSLDFKLEDSLDDNDSVLSNAAVLPSDDAGLLSVQDLLQEAKQLAVAAPASTVAARPKAPVRRRKMALDTREVDILFGEYMRPRSQNGNSNYFASTAKQPAQQPGPSGNVPRTAMPARAVPKAALRAPPSGNGSGKPLGGSPGVERGRPGSRMLSNNELQKLMADGEDFSDSIRPGR